MYILRKLWDHLLHHSKGVSHEAGRPWGPAPRMLSAKGRRGTAVLWAEEQWVPDGVVWLDSVAEKQWGGHTRVMTEDGTTEPRWQLYWRSWGTKSHVASPSQQGVRGTWKEVSLQLCHNSGKTHRPEDTVECFTDLFP